MSFEGPTNGGESERSLEQLRGDAIAEIENSKKCDRREAVLELNKAETFIETTFSMWITSRGGVLEGAHEESALLLVQSGVKQETAEKLVKAIEEEIEGRTKPPTQN